MPLIEKSDYKAPFHYRNGHVSTILPSLLKNEKVDDYERERIELTDGDFLDLDWIKTDDSKKLVIISHGLEGSSKRHYVLSCARYFHNKGWNVLAWNCRSCSEEMNRLPRLYHHGATDDLGAVIDHAINLGYQRISLIGYSMGGSMSLKYLGEAGDSISSKIIGAAVFSVPCNLGNSAEMLVKSRNRIYKQRFLKKLKRKIIKKAKQFPDEIDITGIKQLKTFEEFDSRYTAPLHGFRDRDDFYSKATCDQYIPKIKVPSLIVNALNDPLLGESCYPFELTKDHKNVFLETPKRGGHVGFPIGRNKHSWSEIRAFEFLEGLD